MLKAKKISLIIFALLCAFFHFPAFAELSPDEIVLKVDETRNPQLDYTVSVTVTSLKPNHQPQKAAYEVLVKGRDKTIVKTLFPQVERGRVLLMRDNDLWAFLPDVSKPLRISMQERLIGEVANGDIARANFSGDYTPQLMHTENIEDRQYYTLELTAKRDNVTYGKVVLWAETETFRPLKAEFYAISGRLLKTCSYENYRMLGEKLRPSRLVMEDPIRKGHKSVIEYDNIRVEELPEKYFTKDYMKKFMD